MGKIANYFFVIVVALAVAGITACDESPPPAPQPQVVKQKIEPPQAAAPPTAQAPAPAPGPDAKPAQGAAATDPQAAPASDAKADPETSELVKASQEIASSYDPKDRFDPFEPLFKEEGSAPVARPKEKRKKRKPQTPLERVAISQLKLSAIMRMSTGNSAIVEDATGKGYVIRKGTYVGLNAGQVTRIDKDRVVIEEEIENVMGELIIQNTELKLQKPAGEL